MAQLRSGVGRCLRTCAILALSASILGSCSLATPEGCSATPRMVATAVNSALAPLLTASIRQSREAALRSGVQPLPRKIKSQLAPFFDAAILSEVRWTVSSDRLSLDTLINAISPRYRAITFRDVVVFQTQADAANLALWMHELIHVEQYRRAGSTSRFSRAYLASWSAIETAAVRKTNLLLDSIDFPSRQALPSIRRSCGPGEEPTQNRAGHKMGLNQGD